MENPPTSLIASVQPSNRSGCSCDQVLGARACRRPPRRRRTRARRRAAAGRRCAPSRARATAPSRPCPSCRPRRGPRRSRRAPRRRTGARSTPRRRRGRRRGGRAPAAPGARGPGPGSARPALARPGSDSWITELDADLVELARDPLRGRPLALARGGVAGVGGVDADEVGAAARRPPTGHRRGAVRGSRPWRRSCHRAAPDPGSASAMLARGAREGAHLSGWRNGRRASLRC